MEHAKIVWDDEVPRSTNFDDVYYSRRGGLEEARRVFLEQSGIPERWSEATDFTVGETGFGTGLNFLATWDSWARTAPRGCRLHYLSFEAFPLRPEDLRRSLTPWPELGPKRDALLDHYPLPTTGIHRLRLDSSVFLTLVFSDIAAGFDSLLSGEPRFVDAWYLDGFSPARNPEMWSREILEQVASRTRPGGTVATFTAAGAVRRDLAEVGFEMSRRPGFGGKREMLGGQLPGRPPPRSPRAVVVIGGGLAGAAAASSLSLRGHEVTLIERHSRLGQETSGNPAGILMPYISAEDSPRDRFFRAGFELSRACVRGLESEWHQTGVLHLPKDDRGRHRFARIRERSLPPELVAPVDAEQAADRCGFPAPEAGLFYPRAGWLHPPAVVEGLASGVSRVILSREAVKWEKRDDGLVVSSENGEIAAGDCVVVANALDAAPWLAPMGFPLRAVRGQISLVPASSRSRELRAVICQSGYFLPARHDRHCLGATFQRGDSEPTVRAEDHIANLAWLERSWPELHQAARAAAPEDPALLEGRVGFRCTTPDRMPVVGSLDGSSESWISVGHGSRGLATTVLAGELIASSLSGEVLPVTADVRAALDPARFARRKWDVS